MLIVCNTKMLIDEHEYVQFDCKLNDSMIVWNVEKIKHIL